MKRLLAVVMLLVGCASAPTGSKQPDDLLYVTNQSDASVSVIDTRTNDVVRVVDLTKLGFGPNSKPHHVQVEADGSFYYVSLIGENKVVKLDRNDHVVGQAAFESPGMMSLDPHGAYLYVGRSMTAANPPKSVGVIRRATMDIEEIGVLFPRPHAMVNASHTIYTGSLAVNQIAAIDKATEKVEITNVAGNPHSLMMYALSPDQKWLAISGELSHQVLLFDLSNRMQPKFVRSWNVEMQPFDPIYTNDGRYIVLGNKAANAITVIDTKTNDVKVIRGEGIVQPHGTVASADGKWVYASNNNLTVPVGAHAMPHDMNNMSNAPAKPAGPGTVVVLDTHSWKIVKVIEVGHNAAGMAVRAR